MSTVTPPTAPKPVSRRKTLPPTRPLPATTTSPIEAPSVSCARRVPRPSAPRPTCEQKGKKKKMKIEILPIQKLEMDIKNRQKYANHCVCMCVSLYSHAQRSLRRPEESHLLLREPVMVAKTSGTLGCPNRPIGPEQPLRLRKSSVRRKHGSTTDDTRGVGTGRVRPKGGRSVAIPTRGQGQRLTVVSLCRNRVESGRRRCNEGNGRKGRSWRFTAQLRQL